MALGFVYYKDLTTANDCGFAPFCLLEPYTGWRWQTTAALQVFPTSGMTRWKRAGFSLQITWEPEIKPTHTGRKSN